MKLFLTIFSAILAAAAVIWGVVSFRASVARDEAGRVSSIQLLIRSAELTLKRIELTGKIDPITAKMTLEAPALFGAQLKLGLPDDASPSLLKDRFADTYRDAIALAKEKGLTSAPWGERDEPTLAWAEEMKKRLDSSFPN